MYELVTRHFLACVSADAFGKETTVNVVIAEQEKFYANGLMIIERNYLDVYPYEKWSDKEIPNYENIQGYYFFCSFHANSIMCPSKHYFLFVIFLVTLKE